MSRIIACLLSLVFRKKIVAVRYWFYSQEFLNEFIPRVCDFRNKHPAAFERLRLIAEVGPPKSSLRFRSEADLMDQMLSDAGLLGGDAQRRKISWHTKNLILGLTIDLGDLTVLDSSLPAVEEAYRSSGIIE